MFLACSRATLAPMTEHHDHDTTTTRSPAKPDPRNAESGGTMLRRNNVPPGIAPADHRATARLRHLGSAGPPRQAARRPTNGRSLAALPPPPPHGDCRRNPPARRHRGSLVGGSRHRARQGRGNPGSRRGIARQDAGGLGARPARRREPRPVCSAAYPPGTHAGRDTAERASSARWNRRDCIGADM